MGFTDYGIERFDAEADRAREALNTTVEGLRAVALGGATLHAYMVGLDTGERYVLTGEDAYGKAMRREAGSIQAVQAIQKAARGYKRAWHIRSDGTWKQVWTRY